MEFEKKEAFLFAVTDNKKMSGEKKLFVAKTDQRFVEAQFPVELPLKNFHVADVSSDGQLLVVVNHGGNHSNLYASVRVGQYEVCSANENIKIKYQTLQGMSNI